MRRDLLAAKRQREMGKEGMSDQVELTPRDIGRAWANELQAAAEADGEPDRWFDELYERAAGRPEYIPWETAAPRFKLKEWLASHPGGQQKALDIGCGLGDNAVCLAQADYEVVAFDLSATAVKWAEQRFDNHKITFTQGDVFNLPDAWIGSFDLVHETYNLQAMPQDRVDEAIREIAKLVKPGGTLLVLTRSRGEDEVPHGPPWPLTRVQLRGFESQGLVETEFEVFGDERSEPIPHFLLSWKRPA